ncbi:cholecystokinin receptor type A-like [Aplysia californica]|uniref:Cholecystokinin receptor type A-like n=1 Tax=Aplysia californica TaxID=6500 RepID=A0ABM0JCH8_APLCA|nr:cholecystokinin receptor type A-like [Aplysia californica]
MEVTTSTVSKPDDVQLIHLTPPDPDVGQLISREFRNAFEEILQILIVIINLFGVVSNSINIRVFVRQGVMSDTTTIGLFALAISDLLGCFFMLPPTVCFLIKYLRLGTYVDFRNCHSYTAMAGHYTHVMFSRITCWLTVYISIERSLCVLIPLKIKFLLRPALTKKVVILIYTFWVIFHIPYAVNTRIVPEYSEVYNRTMAFVRETPLAPLFLKINVIVASTILTTVAMVLVAITTFILIFKLKTTSKWRQSVSSAPISTASDPGSGVPFSSSSSSSKAASGKEKEVMVTVTTITTIYLGTLVGSHIPAIALVSLPGVTLAGSNSNLFYITYYTKFFMDSINSSVNIIMYLKFSSRYKAAFNSIYFPEKVEGKGNWH